MEAIKVPDYTAARREGSTRWQEEYIVTALMIENSGAIIHKLVFKSHCSAMCIQNRSIRYQKDPAALLMIVRGRNLASILGRA